MREKEILDLLHITGSKYRRYKAELLKQDKNLLGELVSDNLCAEIISMIEAYHDTIESCKNIISKHDTSFEVLEAERLKILCHQEIVRSLANSPAMFAAVIGTPAFKDLLLHGSVDKKEYNIDIKLDDEAVAP
jgi:hypothetical protein